MKRTIKLRTFLPYPSEKVWRALTNPEMLGSWLMENNIMPKPGHHFTFRMEPQKGWDGITHCEIISLEEGKHISYTYRGEATGEKALACAGIHSSKADKLTKGIFTKLDTVVSFTLDLTCGGTVLTLEHSGFKGLKLVIISLIMQMGWNKQLNRRLPKVLERTNNL